MIDRLFFIPASRPTSYFYIELHEPYNSSRRELRHLAGLTGLRDMSHSPGNRAAYFEEYNEDAHTTLPETRQTANIAVKRSKTDIAKTKVADTPHERSSDSGYSSQTVATVNSGDSSLESKAGSKASTKPLKLETNAAATKRRPAAPEKSLETVPQSPLKSPLRRTASRAQDRSSKAQKDCACEECRGKVRQSIAPLETSWPLLLAQQVQPRHQASANLQPPRPSKPRSPPDVPVVQPAQVRPRALTSQSHRAVRPMSYHCGVTPQPMYMPPVYQERRQPPPHLAPITYPMPSFPPTRGSYFPQSSQLPPQPQEAFPVPLSPYEYPPCPQVRSWPTAQVSQPVIYGSAPIEYTRPLVYRATTPSAQPMPRHSFSNRERPPPLREAYLHRDEDYYTMPPPSRPTPSSQQQQQRPIMKHAATTSVAYPLLHHRRSRRAEEDTEYMSSRRSARQDNTGEFDRSRRPLASRPSATVSSDKSNSSHSVEHKLGRMSIESSNPEGKHGKRVSYHGHRTLHDHHERDAEAYQTSKNNSAGVSSDPFTVDSLKLVRKKTHTSSDTGSRVSGEGKSSREGSDVKPRSSTDRRGGSDVKTRNEHDGVTVRFHPSSGVNLDLKGSGVEGRTISLRQSREGEGEMELSIGTKERHTREKSRRRYSYIEGNSIRELEPARNSSRMRRERQDRAESERESVGERRPAGTGSRQSSRSRFGARALAQ